MAPGESSFRSGAALRRAGLAASLVLHAVAIAAILSHPPTRSAIATAMPIMVSLITAAPATEPTTPPRPLPVRRKVERAQSKPIQALPLVATKSEAFAQFEAPTTPVPVLPPIEAAPRHADSAELLTAAPAVAAPALVPPRFDAAYLENPPPTYPPLARRMGEQGRVLLRVLVAADGLAQQVELKTGSGSARLDQAALDTVRRWRFVPARQGDQRVAAWVLVPISFSLEG